MADRQTDHTTRSVATEHIYVHSTVMQPNNCTAAYLNKSLCKYLLPQPSYWRWSNERTRMAESRFSQWSTWIFTKHKQYHILFVIYKCNIAFSALTLLGIGPVKKGGMVEVGTG